MRSHGQRGCSLIEVLIATAILAIGLGSLAQLFTLAVGSNLASTHRTRAAMLAAQKLEEVRALDWEVALQGGGVDAVGELTRRWTVSPLPSNPDHAAIVDVLVTWNGSRVGHLATIKARRTP